MYFLSNTPTSVFYRISTQVLQFKLLHFSVFRIPDVLYVGVFLMKWFITYFPGHRPLAVLITDGSVTYKLTELLIFSVFLISFFYNFPTLHSNEVIILRRLMPFIWRLAFETSIHINHWAKKKIMFFNKWCIILWCYLAVLSMLA